MIYNTSFAGKIVAVTLDDTVMPARESEPIMDMTVHVPMWMHESSTVNDPVHVPICAVGWDTAGNDEACEYMGFG